MKNVSRETSAYYKKWYDSLRKRDALGIIINGTTNIFETGQDRKVAAIRISVCVYPFYILRINQNKRDTMIRDEEYFMREAIREAQKAEQKEEVPIGAIIVLENKIIARGHNLREKKQLSLAHAEIEAINKACRKMKSWRLENCDLYVTLEPCPMCAGAILQSRIRKVIIGAYDPKRGSTGSCFNLYQIPGFNHYPLVSGGVLEEECAQLLKEFFRKKREKRKENKKEFE